MDKDLWKKIGVGTELGTVTNVPSEVDPKEPQ
jgi:hypothetical protein